MDLIRQKIRIEGRVQGVGFRPFVFHLAQKHFLTGVVYNSGSAVVIEVQGPADALARFQLELIAEAPSNSRIEKTKVELLQVREHIGAPFREDIDFRIVSSEQPGNSASLPSLPYLPNDFAICRDCLSDLKDPQNPRFAYPFTHCAACGPRWCLLEALPFDRSHTSMRDFPLCSRCSAEYSSPGDRRFHAQTISCPQCGPSVFLQNAEALVLGAGQTAISRAAELILAGRIVAVKGVGGFQLWCRADRTQTVRELRERKRRPQKAFALMVPSLELARELCELTPVEERCLLSIEAPIVLLQRNAGADEMISSEVAPGLSELGLMLPCTPLHYLLMEQIKLPIIATSANVTDEPLAYENDDALLRLQGIADFFLCDNRRIVRAVDDSVVRIVGGRLQILRLARGYAPAVFQPTGLKACSALGYGADLKASLCFQKVESLVLSEHLGELGSDRSIANFEKERQDIAEILALQQPAVTVRDLHPDLVSSRLAPLAAVTVQHHLAHFFSAFIEHQIAPPTLGIIWDGTGLGLNRQIWGGEFLFFGVDHTVQRRASLRPFKLLGGDFAMRDTRRIAFTLLKEIDGLRHADLFRFSVQEKAVWSDFGATISTTSMGRLFDGVRALLLLAAEQYSPPTYEGEHAIQLEELAKAWRKSQTTLDLERSDQEFYPYSLSDAAEGVLEVDWRPMLKAVVLEICEEQHHGAIADKFQRTLIQIAVSVALQCQPVAPSNANNVVLAGGCFQNRFLLETMSQELKRHGYAVYWPEQIPIHDGGISAGQIYCVNRSKL